jgi:hypothetical protein
MNSEMEEKGREPMINTVWAVIHDGRIELLHKITAPEGTRVLVTLLLEDEADFWLDAGSISLKEIWDNAEDDRYAELLKA